MAIVGGDPVRLPIQTDYKLQKLMCCPSLKLKHVLLLGRRGSLGC